MKYNTLKSQINRPFFSRQSLRLAKLPVFNYQLTAWTKKNYIAPLKRGTYYFIDRKSDISPQEVSYLIYQPSYISLESALSYYGLIPEIIHSITAVTPKTNRRFSNDFGHFNYRHIKPSIFFGYQPIETKYGQYLMAEPEKALLDYLYLNSGQINNKTDILELRLNFEIFNHVIESKKLLSYLENYQNKKLEKLINLILKQCKQSNS